MKQNQILENTKKMTDRSLELTQSVIEKSKKLRTPSPKIDKIGTTIGYVASTSLLIGRVIQIIVGKPTWALGSLSAGAIALLSNRYHYHHIKNKKIKTTSKRRGFLCGYKPLLLARVSRRCFHFAQAIAFDSRYPSKGFFLLPFLFLFFLLLCNSLFFKWIPVFLHT